MEYWEYEKGGGLIDPFHYDVDSILTIVALLSGDPPCTYPAHIYHPHIHAFPSYIYPPHIYVPPHIWAPHIFIFHMFPQSYPNPILTLYFFALIYIPSDSPTLSSPHIITTDPTDLQGGVFRTHESDGTMLEHPMAQVTDPPLHFNWSSSSLYLIPLHYLII